MQLRLIAFNHDFKRFAPADIFALYRAHTIFIPAVESNRETIVARVDADLAAPCQPSGLFPLVAVQVDCLGRLATLDIPHHREVVLSTLPDHLEVEVHDVLLGAGHQTLDAAAGQLTLSRFTLCGGEHAAPPGNIHRSGADGSRSGHKPPAGGAET